MTWFQVFTIQCLIGKIALKLRKTQLKLKEVELKASIGRDKLHMLNLPILGFKKSNSNKIYKFTYPIITS